jgi:hypothetical protein
MPTGIGRVAVGVLAALLVAGLAACVPARIPSLQERRAQAEAQGVRCPRGPTLVYPTEGESCPKGSISCGIPALVGGSPGGCALEDAVERGLEDRGL